MITDDLLVAEWSWRLRETADPGHCLLELLGPPAPGLVVDAHLAPYAVGCARLTLDARIPARPFRSRRARHGTITSVLGRLIDDLEELLDTSPAMRRHERTRHAGRVALGVGSHRYQGELFDLAPGGIGIVLGPDHMDPLTLRRGLRADVRMCRMAMRDARSPMIVAHVTPRGVGWLIGLQGPMPDSTPVVVNAPISQSDERRTRPRVP
jgi:hypothetical protein